MTPSIDTSAFNASSEGTILSLDSEYPGEPVYRARRRAVPKHLRGFFPAAMFSVFVSTASVLTDSRMFLGDDSSTTLTWYHRARKRISLAEARQRAMRALLFNEQRRADFAEREGREFSVLYGWESR